MRLQDIQIGEHYRAGDTRGRAINIDQATGTVYLLDEENERTHRVNAEEINEAYDAQYHCRGDIYY